MNRDVRQVIRFARQKRLPTENKSIHLLLTRISIELGEAQDAYMKGNSKQLKQELIDVLIQTLQALGAMSVDVDKEFQKTMAANDVRDFSRHKRAIKK